MRAVGKVLPRALSQIFIRGARTFRSPDKVSQMEMPILPRKVAELRRLTSLSFAVFLVFQVAGVILLFHDISTIMKNLDLSNLTFTIPSVEHTSFQNFISGTSLSMTAGFWLSLTLASFRLKKPYSHKAYGVLNFSFYAQIFFFVLSLYGVFKGHKALFNPGTLGTALTIVFTAPIYIKAQDLVIKRWSQEYIPPPPELPEGAY